MRHLWILTDNRSFVPCEADRFNVEVSKVPAEVTCKACLSSKEFEIYRAGWETALTLMEVEHKGAVDKLRFGKR